ncbi:MAG TPA: DNA polymerase III subunit gamma/tau, partial [Verrucomicrobiae bacterium]|nr:DNA polymerase III subunit gamma/tau [Verrucomicrobiae bacterium]
MSYLALARKWRPRKFEDVLGQPHVVKALSHALDADKLHPAILLTGTRGVGKTTLARIIAKGLNCETRPGSDPCGTCSACQQVDQGRYVDLLEIDAASHTGVDNVREQLIDNAQYAPSRGKYKVYLIDEVHMLSKAAFNALLKTLEEPPPHVKFILATTDPQKLPITVLSRCLQFNLRRLPAATIRELLGQVLANEGLKADAGALSEIARAADGSMRDGLSLLDQAIAFCGGKDLGRAQVEDMLGTQGRQILFEVLRAVVAGQGDALLACVDKLDAQAPDYAALLNDLASILQRAGVLQVLPQAADEGDDPAIGELAKAAAPEDVQVWYQIVINGRRDLPWAPDPRLGFEMTLLRLLAFRPGEAGSMQPAGAGSTPAARPAAGGARAAPLAGDAGWPARVAALELEGFAKQLARHCGWSGRDGNVVRLSLDDKMKHLLVEDRRMGLEQA